MLKKIVYLISGLSILSGILFLFYIFFWTPDEKKARSIIQSTLSYYPPTSSKLIYSKNYWESLDSKEPRSMCFVFQYTQQDLTTLLNYDFYNNNQEVYRHSPISKNKGCNYFFSNIKAVDLALFEKHFKYFQRLQGGTIFINKDKQIVLFEAYLFD